MAFSWKKIIDRNCWVPIGQSPNAHAAGGSLASDLRNDLTRNPFGYQLVSNTVLNRYNTVTKAWNFIVSPALAGTFGAGAGCVFAPSHSLRGTLAAGSTTTDVVLSTALPAAPGLNMLANRGASGEYGYKIRIIGSSAGGSGNTEERWIVGNTASLTATIQVDTAFSFTPAAGDTYEITSGRLFMLGAGTLASASWRSFDVAVNFLATKTQTNLPATISTDFSAVCLDELYVPHNRKPGEGFLIGAGTYDGGAFGCLTATATAAGTLTGEAAAGDSAVLANEYRNFQIRIVEDTAIPTAVGQRRIIASHTAGASPVYTLGSNWTVTPTATAKYVIELPSLIVLFTTGSGTTYTYNYSYQTCNNGTNSIAADAWSSTYFAGSVINMGAGCTSFGSWGIVPDASKNARHSVINRFRGGGSASLDTLDIAGGATGLWALAVTYDGSGMSTPNTGTCGKYAPADKEGRFGYLNIYVASGLNQLYRYDVKNRVLSPYTPTDFLQTGAAAVGDRVATLAVIDGSDKYTLVVLLSHLSASAFEIITVV